MKRRPRKGRITEAGSRKRAHESPDVPYKNRRPRFVRFANVDWSKRDVELAAELGVSRERVRQVRKAKQDRRATYYHKADNAIAVLEWASPIREQLAGKTAIEVAALCPVRVHADTIRRLMRNLRIPFRMPISKRVTRDTIRTFCTETAAGCWEWNGAGKGVGYGQIGSDYAHRVSYRLFIGEIPDGMMVMHTCDSRVCVNPAHLFIGTGADSVANRTHKGRTASKLTIDQVREIKAMIGKGERLSAIAAKCGVSYDCVRYIRRGRTWKWIDNPLPQALAS